MSAQHTRGTVVYADALQVVRLAEFNALQKSRDELLAALIEIRANAARSGMTTERRLQIFHIADAAIVKAEGQS